MGLSAPMLILDVADVFARDRGMNGPRPAPLGKVQLFLIAQTDPVTQTLAPLAKPLEMKVVPNGSGFLLFFGKVFTPDGSVRSVAPDRWPWTIRAVDVYYQDLDLTPDAVPESFGAPVAGAGATAPIRFDLLPGPAYPFPEDPPAQAVVLLRGTLRNPDGSGLAGVQVTALDANNQPRPNPSVTAADGQWVITLPQLPAEGLASIRFTDSDGNVTDVTGVRVVAGRDNNLAQTALRGQVRLARRGIEGAVIGVNTMSATTLTNSDGNWFLYFSISQASGSVRVTATLPDQGASKAVTAMLQPRATVVVPAFEF
jgi:hypothetical protein